MLSNDKRRLKMKKRWKKMTKKQLKAWKKKEWRNLNRSESGFSI